MAESKEIAKQPLIKQYLEKHKDQIAAALPRHLDADRMARVMMTCVSRDPKLLKCSPKSLFGAMIQASQLGLEPGSALGHCYLVPYNNKQGAEVQMQIGYRGMIELAMRSEKVLSITSRIVRAQDAFNYSYGIEDRLEHTPGPETAEITHVYAIAKMSSGATVFEVMTINQVHEIRKQSKMRGEGPWDTHFEEMARKTPIRRLFKYLPVSIEIQTAIGLDDQADAGIVQNNSALIEGDFFVEDEIAEDPEPPKSGTAGVKDKLGAKDEKPAPKDDGPEPEYTFESVKTLINDVENSDELDYVTSIAKENFTGELRKELGKLITAKSKELKEVAANE